jgi:L-alanine-DL-glutamate epimerase-like enolase superfamily enzyme
MSPSVDEGEGVMAERVEAIEVVLLEREMGGKVWNPRQRWDTKRILLVFARGSSGRHGVGECWTSGGEAAIRTTIEAELAPLMVGRSVFEVAAVTEQVRKGTELSGRTGIAAAAWSGIETAVMDLAAKSLDLPLADLLGRAQGTVGVYASAGLYGSDKTPEDLAAEVKGWVDAGFDAVKIKVGGAPLAEDVRRLAAVREAIGPVVRLMVDALYNLDVAEALAMARAFEPFAIHSLEAPVSPFDLDGQARVAKASAIPICGNENMAWTGYFKALVERRAVHFVQFDIAACGGIAEGRRIGELAHLHHLPCTLHAASSAVLYAASLHLAASLPNAVSVEHHMLHQWLWELAPKRAFKPVNSRLAPPPGPGIGIELTPDDVR